eukprot:GDKJ01044505.1.p1 GENE.GDKJ01044505.1~~GDKJ01044505.1.p1  ORF type:complete len:683 (+),score=92.18 GDKJ01044505.1:35-2083(+)
MSKICRSVKSPTPIAAHSVVCYRSYIYVFGGWDGRRVLNDLFQHSIDEQKWYNIDCDIPPASRNKHVACVVGNEMFVHGGNNGKLWLDDLCSIDLSASRVNRYWDTRKCFGDIPSPRGSHSMTNLNGQIFIFGGFDGVNVFNSLHSFDPRTRMWTLLKATGATPPSRSTHSAVPLSDNSSMLIFGGLTEQNVALGHEFYFFNSRTCVWTQIQTTLPPLSGATGVWLPSSENSSSSLIVFGGKCSEGDLIKSMFLCQFSANFLESFSTVQSTSSVNNRIVSCETINLSQLVDTPFKTFTPRHRHACCPLNNLQSSFKPGEIREFVIVGGVDEQSWIPDCLIFDARILMNTITQKNSINDTNLSCSQQTQISTTNPPFRPTSVVSSNPKGDSLLNSTLQLNSNVALTQSQPHLTTPPVNPGPNRVEVMQEMASAWMTNCVKRGVISNCKFGYVKRGDCADLLAFGRGIEAVARGEGGHGCTSLGIIFVGSHMMQSKGTDCWAKVPKVSKMFLGFNGISTIADLKEMLKGSGAVLGCELDELKVFGDRLTLGLGSIEEEWESLNKRLPSLGGVPRVTWCGEAWGGWKNQEEIEKMTGRKQLLRTVKSCLLREGLIGVVTFNGQRLDNVEEIGWTAGRPRGQRNEKLVSEALERCTERLKSVLQKRRMKSVEQLIIEGRKLQGIDV